MISTTLCIDLCSICAHQSLHEPFISFVRYDVRLRGTDDDFACMLNLGKFGRFELELGLLEGFDPCGSHPLDLSRYSLPSLPSLRKTGFMLRFEPMKEVNSSEQETKRASSAAWRALLMVVLSVVVLFSHEYSMLLLNDHSHSDGSWTTQLLGAWTSLMSRANIVLLFFSYALVFTWLVIGQDRKSIVVYHNYKPCCLFERRTTGLFILLPLSRVNAEPLSAD